MKSPLNPPLSYDFPVKNIHFPRGKTSASHVLTTRLPVLNTAASYDGNAAWRALGLDSPKVAKRDGAFLK